MVATTLVSDAMSKMVSTVIGSVGGHERARADRLPVQDALALTDQDHRARHVAPRDGSARCGSPRRPMSRAEW